MADNQIIFLVIRLSTSNQKEIDFEVQLNRLWSVDCERLYAVARTPKKTKSKIADNDITFGVAAAWLPRALCFQKIHQKPLQSRGRYPIGRSRGLAF